MRSQYAASGIVVLPEQRTNVQLGKFEARWRVALSTDHPAVADVRMRRRARALVVAWWDKAAGSLRTERSKALLEIGRRAEKYSIQFEKARTGKEPVWQGLETAVSGYDVLSVVSGESERRLKIEVKGSSMRKGEASFFVTRNEWNTATTSTLYHFHLWLVRDEPKLFVVPAQDVLPHIPADQGSGKWQGAELYFRDFSSYEQSVSLS
jgi:uncharacterized protein DUF3883